MREVTSVYHNSKTHPSARVIIRRVFAPSGWQRRPPSVSDARRTLGPSWNHLLGCGVCRALVPRRLHQGLWLPRLDIQAPREEPLTKGLSFVLWSLRVLIGSSQCMQLQGSRKELLVSSSEDSILVFVFQTRIRSSCPYLYTVGFH